MLSDAFTLGVVAATASIGAAIDLRTRRIPNALTVPSMVCGVTLAALGVGDLSVRSALLGCALGLLLMLPGHVFGGTGSGDVKLVAALGTWLGPERILSVFVYSVVAGGFIAIGYAIARGRLETTLRQTARLMASPGEAKQEIEAPAAGNRFPYGPAIAVGALLVVFGY